MPKNPLPHFVVVGRREGDDNSVFECRARTYQGAEKKFRAMVRANAEPEDREGLTIYIDAIISSPAPTTIHYDEWGYHSKT